MMTREQFILRKQEIEVEMKQTRVKQHNETAKVNEDYELRLRDLDDAYRRQKRALFDERDAVREQINEHYKAMRRDLWVEDTNLVAAWRQQLLGIETINEGGTEL